MTRLGWIRPSTRTYRRDRATPRPRLLKTMAGHACRIERNAVRLLRTTRASFPTFAIAAALRTPARCGSLACGHFALRDAIERLVEPLTPTRPCRHLPRACRVRMVWARRSSLTPGDFALGQVLLKDFGDRGDQCWAEESSCHEVPCAGDAGRFWLELIGAQQPRQRSRQLAWLDHAEAHAVEAVDEGQPARR